MNPIRPFCWPTIRLLPMDFTGDMSDYTFLLHLCKKINETIQRCNELGIAVTELQKQFEALQKFVEDYFNGLNVRGEIENVINEMLKNGDFQKVLEEVFGETEVPGNATAGVLNKIMECAYTYYENQDKLVYAHRYEAHNGMNYQYGPQQFTVDGKTGYAINCNSFGNLVLLGVPFEGSMYNLKNGHYNQIGQMGYRYNILGEVISQENYLQIDTTRDMGKRFREKHRLYKANSTFSNVQPGDMLFYIDVNKDLSDVTDITEAFDHCSIVLSVPGREYVNNRIATNSIFNTVEVVGGANPIVFRRNTVANLQDTFHIDNIWIGRPMYPQMPAFNRGEAYFNGMTSNNVTINVEDLGIRNNEFITVDIDFMPSAVNQVVETYFNGNYYALESYHQTLSIEGDIGKVIHYQFVTLARANASNTNSDAISTIEFKKTAGAQIGNIKIVKGFGGIITPHYYRYYVANNTTELISVMQGIQKEFFTYKTTTVIEARLYLSIPQYTEGTYSCLITVDSTCVWVHGPEVNFKFMNNHLLFYNGIANVTEDTILSLPVGFMGKSSNAINGSTANFIFRGESGYIAVGGNYIKTSSNSGSIHTWSSDQL